METGSNIGLHRISNLFLSRIAVSGITGYTVSGKKSGRIFGGRISGQITITQVFNGGEGGMQYARFVGNITLPINKMQGVYKVLYKVYQDYQVF